VAASAPAPGPAREAKGLPKVDRHLSSAERWCYQRFDHVHLQERGADFGKAISAADAAPRSEHDLEPEAG
jgi:hypothetical protein